jgi:hypothetical protein
VGRVRTGVNLYPWDVVGDPRAGEWVATLGVDEVTLAAAYHATRAITPRHPSHRIVTAEQTAVYYPLDPHRWAGRALRPAAQTACAGVDPFGAAVASLAAAGQTVNAWAVLLHVDGRLAGGPAPIVVNAYGDGYPWALCAARAEAREYAAGLAAETAARPGLGGLELEACGWYGFGHLHSHDKTGGVPPGGAADFLLSLCFCPACQALYADAGLDPAELRDRVAGVMDALFDPAAQAGTVGQPDPAAQSGAVTQLGQVCPEWSVVERMLGDGVAEAVLAARRRAGDELRAEVLAAVRAAAGPDLPVLLHADPLPHRTGAYAGLDPATALAVADGLVVSCWGSPATADDTVRAAAAGARPGSRIVASMLAVRGLGAQLDDLPARAAAAVAAGATDLRFYHAGLATTADLAAITATARQFG